PPAAAAGVSARRLVLQGRVRDSRGFGGKRVGTWRTRHNRRLSGNERERRGMSARDGAARRRAPSAGRRPARPVGAADAEPQDEEVTMLLEQAHRALHEGRVAEAEYLMRQILHYGHVSAVYNNLALLQLEYYHR